jgi:calcineurin-like phosphoesterase family protein
MSKVCITSDQHFGHSNSIHYCNRPFDNVEQMDEYMIKQWNKVVNKEDKVLCHGDFSFYGFEKTKKIFDTLNGHKSIILGNHDNHANKWFLEIGFKEIFKYPILYAERYILSHDPVPTIVNSGLYNIHGHTHRNLYGDAEVGGWYNICVDNTNFKPIVFSNKGRIIFEDNYKKRLDK